MGKFQTWLHGAMPYPWARRLAVGVIGGTVVLVGIALVFLPGPALVVIPIGLGILGLEFAWARRLLKHARDRAGNFVGGMRGRNGGAAVPAPERFGERREDK